MTAAPKLEYGPLPAPEPGFYENVPDEDYHRWRAASQSVLKELAAKRSPAHIHYEIAHPEPPTAADRVGTALHVRTLQPHLFEQQVVEAPEINRRTNAGKEQWAAFQLEHASKTILKPEEMAGVQGMAAAVESHPAAHLILRSKGPFEGSLVHDFDIPVGKEVLHLRCKARIDHYDEELETIVDVKTTAFGASPPEFERAMARFGYHHQAGFYTTLMNNADLPARHFVFIVVEKAPPYAVAVYKLMQDDIEHGFADLLKPMETLARCFRDDEWPAYSDEVTEVCLPDWKRKEYLFD